MPSLESDCGGPNPVKKLFDALEGAPRINNFLTQALQSANHFFITLRSGRSPAQQLSLEYNKETNKCSEHTDVPQASSSINRFTPSAIPPGLPWAKEFGLSAPRSGFLDLQFPEKNTGMENAWQLETPASNLFHSSNKRLFGDKLSSPTKKQRMDNTFYSPRADSDDAPSKSGPLTPFAIKLLESMKKDKKPETTKTTTTYTPNKESMLYQEPEPDDALESEKVFEFNIKTLNKRGIMEFCEKFMYTKKDSKKNPDFFQQHLLQIQITFDGEIGDFNMVGRPKIPGAGTRQLSHVVNFSAIKDAIKNCVIQSTDASVAIDKLINLYLACLSQTSGYAIGGGDLKDKVDASGVGHKTYNDKKTNKEYYLLTPNRGKIIFSAQDDSTKDCAQTIYKSLIVERASIFLNMLNKNLLENNQAVQEDACEVIACIITILFNSMPHTSFSPVGNSPTHEIRFTKKGQGKKEFEVITVRELQKKLKDGKKEIKEGTIRMVNCEGSDITKSTKIIEFLSLLLKEIGKAPYLSDNKQKIEDKIKNYNENYNFTIKLENVATTELKEYNNDILYINYDKKIPLHIAKAIYRSFGLKALPEYQIQQIPSSSPTKSYIMAYPSATATTTKKYKITCGKKQRRDDIDMDDKESLPEFYRSAEIDKKILPNKLVFALFLEIWPYLSVNSEDNNKLIIKQILGALSNLAAIDYEMEKTEENQLLNDMEEVYNTIDAIQELVTITGESQ